MIIRILFFMIFTFFSTLSYAEESSNIASILMRSTFKIQQGSSMGTVFILGEPLKDYPKRGTFVLMTASHVLDAMKGEKATIYLRKKVNESFVKHPFTISLRHKGKPLWVKHPDVDAAAMRLAIPKDADRRLVPTTLLATDEFINKFEVNPGDDLLVLGFPYGAESNEAGFPILRSGRIASYPLTPTRITKTFLLDFEVFRGNSGGPVFMCSRNRAYGGTTHIGVVRQVMGLVSQEKKIIERIKSIDQELLKEHKLSLAVVVHASFLKELLNMLPPIIGQ